VDKALCVNSVYVLLQKLVCGSSVGSQRRLHMPSVNRIRCGNIDNLAARFPPCMRHLHNCLRQKHRLRHMSRVRTVNVHETENNSVKTRMALRRAHTSAKASDRAKSLLLNKV